MDQKSIEIKIDWKRLLKEFEDYRADRDIVIFDSAAFVKSMVSPVPQFVEVFLKIKICQGMNRDDAVRELYSFFLEKRYYEKLNLLHFAFEIFDEDTYLPKEIIDRTPLPNEEGMPLFRYRFDPDFELTIDPVT